MLTSYTVGLMQRHDLMSWGWVQGIPSGGDDKSESWELNFLPGYIFSRDEWVLKGASAFL